MDVTLDLTSGAYARPFEVRAWLLEQGNLERFVILDDDIFWAWNWPGDSFVCTTHLNDKGKCVYGMTDTQRLCSSNERLISAIKNSSAGQQCFSDKGRHWYGAGYRIYQQPAKVIVSPKRTLEAAASYAYAGKKVCVLNFASATNPGGGVIKGSSAQEEAICRCSTLYPNLKEQRMWNQFYSPHRRARDPLHNDDCIYTPSVMVFKSDTDYPQLLPEEKWYSVNVLT